MVIRDIIGVCSERLKQHNIENAVFDSHLIVRTVLNLKPIDVVLSHQKSVDEKDAEKIFEYCDRRCKNEPLQYILGTQEFMGLEFEVSRDVLIPRADTETLVEAVTEERRGMNVLDICTGSGCIAISIAHYNKNAFVTGLDISLPALDTAKRNAVKNGVGERVRFEKCDIMNGIPNGIFDVIVSNPPYIETAEIDSLQKEVCMHEPRIALDGGGDGLDFYRRITAVAPSLLQSGGSLYFEVGYNQAEAVRQLMENSGFEDIRIIKDLCGIQRVVCGRGGEK